jgi:hypothetical protein
MFLQTGSWWLLLPQSLLFPMHNQNVVTFPVRTCQFLLIGAQVPKGNHARWLEPTHSVIWTRQHDGATVACWLQRSDIFSVRGMFLQEEKNIATPIRVYIFKETCHALCERYSCSLGWMQKQFHLKGWHVLIHVYHISGGGRQNQQHWLNVQITAVLSPLTALEFGNLRFIPFFVTLRGLFWTVVKPVFFFTV